MAKSEVQKAAAKEASLLKRAAHLARQRELRESEEAAFAAANNSTAALEYKTATAAEEAATNLRIELVLAIETQIALLKDQITAIRAEHDPQVDALRQAKRQAADTFYAERRRLVAEAESGFPDLHDASARCSSVAWVPPDGYIAQFAAANAGDLAKKKAKREKKAEACTLSA